MKQSGDCVSQHTRPSAVNHAFKQTTEQARGVIQATLIGDRACRSRASPLTGNSSSPQVVLCLDEFYLGSPKV
eukprot:3032348-Rhodomonas_salina.2